MRTVADLEIIRRRDRTDPIDDRRLRMAIADGVWTRVVSGVFVRGDAWRALKPIERHRLKVVECIRRMRAPAIACHAAAAALHGIDMLGAWPARVDVITVPARGGRSTGSIRRHPRDPSSIDVCEIDGIAVTSAAQTALDLARVLPFAHGVAVVDQAIGDRGSAGALTDRETILSLMPLSPHRGDARAGRAISFSDPGAANVRESQSRVVIAQLGFPRPRLQERRVLRSGRLVFGDFFWPEHDHWGELDGHGKYLSPEFGAERDPRKIVIDEKNRENEIRREVRGFSRWEPSDLEDPRRLFDILTADGLPSALPRP
jgi:hypothetical protein